MTNINCLASAVQNALTSWQITSQLSASVRGDLGNVSRVSYFSNDRQALRTRTRTHALNTDWLSDAFTDLMTGQLTESTPLVICHSFFSWGMLEVFKDCPEDFFCYYKIFYNERDVWFISSQSERSGDRVRVSVHPEFWCSLLRSNSCQLSVIVFFKMLQQSLSIILILISLKTSTSSPGNYHEYCVVGAGPGGTRQISKSLFHCFISAGFDCSFSLGLQMGFFLERSGRDYVIFERNNIAGTCCYELATFLT